MVSAILLGAGESKRMGTDKLSLPWAGTTLLGHCLDILLRSDVREVIVVVGGHGTGQVEKRRGFEAKKVKVVRNRDYKEGMSSSIRRGIRSIDPESRGILIALGDQPLLKTKTINALIEAFHRGKGSIFVPVHRGRRGHPVIFGRGFEEELLKLTGDVGARSIIARHPEKVVEVRTRSVAVVKDIDTRKEYGVLSLKQKAKKRKGKTQGAKLKAGMGKAPVSSRSDFWRGLR